MRKTENLAETGMVKVSPTEDRDELSIEIVHSIYGLAFPNIAVVY